MTRHPHWRTLRRRLRVALGLDRPTTPWPWSLVGPGFIAWAVLVHAWFSPAWVPWGLLGGFVAAGGLLWIAWRRGLDLWRSPWDRGQSRPTSRR
jgi:hypothetical protein